jgi:phosphoribosylformylglycinamidine cyclo-ligase
VFIRGAIVVRDRMAPTRSNSPGTASVYDAVGVTAVREEGSLRELAHWVRQTFTLNAVRPSLPLGYYANVLPVRADLAIAISTDGVGTKLLVAEEMGKLDTVGIDCVAMNANDIVCVGAEPISMVDYIAVEVADAAMLGELGKGLYAGAEAAGISIPGGEIAQVREMIRGVREGSGFDLIGTCIGLVHPQRVLIGQDVRPGDAVVGIESSGVHSNGFTLARRVLFQTAGLKVSDHVAELGRTVGEELLEPTHIYVKEAVRMLNAGLGIKAMLHVTGDGFLNLTRVAAEVGYVIDALPQTPPIFSLIQERGGIDDAEMYRVFNMGVGFCVVVAPGDADRTVAIAAEHGRRAAVIGYAVADPERQVWIPEKGIVGQGSGFAPLRGRVPPGR